MWPALVQCWKWRKLDMRFLLIPIRYRRDIVRQRPIWAIRRPTQRLDGNVNVPSKADRIHNMPAIKAPFARSNLIIGTQRTARIGSGESRGQAVTSSEVVLRTCTANGGEIAISVEEKLDFAFSKPTFGQLCPR